MPKLVKRSTNYAAEYFDQAKGFTTRSSLGTSDPRVAERLFGEWLIKNASLAGPDPGNQKLDYIVALFYEKEAKHFPSHYVYAQAKAKVVKYLPGLTINQFKKSVQRGFAGKLTEEGLAPSTVNRIMGAVSAAIGRAYEDEPIRPSVISIPVPTQKRKTFTDDELKALIRAATDVNSSRWVMLATLTGARPGALIRLSKSQFDLEHRLLDLLPPGEAQVRKKFKPCIPLTKALQKAVETWEDGYVFQTDHKKPLASPDSIWEKLSSVVPGATLYTFRRTVAAEMRKQGVAMADIAGYLGHKTQQRVTELYAQYDPMYMRAAADAMDRFWVRITGGNNENGTSESGDGVERIVGSDTEDRREGRVLE